MSTSTPPTSTEATLAASAATPAGPSFASLKLDARVLTAVQEAGYTQPTPIQIAAIPEVLAGHDLIGIAQTGTGKTAAFMLPILTKLAGAGRGAPGIRVLVLVPTRELAAQIEENVNIYAKHLNIRCATIFGGVGERPQMNALRAGTEVIIACPGRLMDLMERRNGNFSGLQHLVLDEADRMLDMGFLPSIRRIVRAMPQQRQTLMFSATLSKEIEGLTRDFQRSPKKIEVGRRANPAETVTQRIYEVPHHLKLPLLSHLLQHSNLAEDMDSVLIFTRTKHGADRVARKLEQLEIRTGVLHSGRSQPQRMRALSDFKCGAVRVLVATDIAARGIDVDGISHVINYDFPMHSDDYVHRIGRTGRAQQVGDAISFVCADDEASLRQLERSIGHGILRAKAEGFDYAMAPAPGASVPRAGLVMHTPNRSGGGRPGGGKGGGGRPGSRPGGGPDGGGNSPKRDFRHSKKGK